MSLHCGDMSAAERVIAKKEAEGLVQSHPDDAELKTYYVIFLVV